VARAAVKAKQQARAKAQPTKHARARGRRRHAGGGNPNQQLFFMKLRRRQKWVFFALAVVFAATFAGVGVGSGSGGLDQLYSGLFGGGGSSISKAQAEVKTDPAKGYRDLARAYEANGDTSSAISALQSYVGVKKRDASAWTELGGLQLSQGQTFAAQYQQAQTTAQSADPSQAFQPSGSLAQIFSANPAQQATSQQVTALLTQLSQQMTTAYSGAMTSYQTAARLQPHDAQAQFELANAAQLAGQYTVELGALKHYLVLNPHSPYRKRFEHLIKQLSPAKPKH
jgi:hypothetical protein